MIEMSVTQPGSAKKRVPGAVVSDAELQRQAEQQLNQLVAEIRMLETYYQEISSRVQAASAALSDSRAALHAIEEFGKSPSSDLLVPIGGGVFLPTNGVEVKRVVLSVGAGVAIEKDTDYAKIFLQARQKELETAITTLDQQRKEIGSRLDAGRAMLQQISGQE